MLLLYPERRLLRVELWQPFTYGFVEHDPMGIIFGAIILYSIGGGLERSLGLASGCCGWRVGGTVLAGFLTVAARPCCCPCRQCYAGGYGDGAPSLWVAYGLSIGRGQTNFWGIPVTGNVLAGIGAGFVILNGLLGLAGRAGAGAVSRSASPSSTCAAAARGACGCACSTGGCSGSCAGARGTCASSPKSARMTGT